MVILLVAIGVGCAGPPTRPTDWVAPDCVCAAQEIAARALVVALSEAEDEALHQANQCQEIEIGLVRCPTEIKLEEWAWMNHLREPAEEELAASLNPPDPVVIRDGLAVYEELLNGVARRTRTHLDLLENTPALNQAELEYFHRNPEVWEATLAYRATPPGQQRLRQLQAAWQQITSREGRRHLLLRDGYLYVEDPVTADWVVRRIELKDLFDQPTIVLSRGSNRFILERGRDGRYYHTDPGYDRYRARLVAIDRVGTEEELGPDPSYNLNFLRRRFGLQRIGIGPETGAGRAGQVVFLDGSRFPARVVRAHRGISLVGVVAEPARLDDTLAHSGQIAEAVYGLVDNIEQMVRENLFFDEPANEVGQQDGIMRHAFNEAYSMGALQYTVNGVTYDIYDDLGRPRPPQVCIDYLTDAVERYAGSWWPPLSAGATRRTQGRIDFRDYMTYRQVRLLVKLAEDLPWVASLFSFGSSVQIPFGDRGAFFRNLWNHRDLFRIADMVVIYGLKADGRYHYHSFYVHDTDPIQGFPITLSDQAGHARIGSWINIMSNAPRRSIRHRVRWNPYWILHPQAANLAGHIYRQAQAVLSPRGNPQVDDGGGGGE
ncbi:MAG: hypothetical protein JW797_15660 [Bradymonadales bacterium]|nr:hypothetical protein [Bradymonadales bacterium]